MRAMRLIKKVAYQWSYLTISCKFQEFISRLSQRHLYRHLYASRTVGIAEGSMIEVYARVYDAYQHILSGICLWQMVLCYSHFFCGHL